MRPSGFERMFCAVPGPRPTEEVVAVLDLKAAGYSDREIARFTGVPINTIRRWRTRGVSRHFIETVRPSPTCAACGDEPHDNASLPRDAYAYMLGVYLGDGYLARNGNSWMLRVVLDDAYPAIASECCDAIEALRGGSRPTPRHDPNGERCLRICSTWRRWICLFPQHGPGHKHERDIVLDGWQREIVDAAPGPFVRGLIHTDGWRGINRVHAKGRNYEYPRYQFSNRSDDIRRLFTDACDRLGVEWCRWTRYHVSVARRESVALLDTFVGPKS